jgi:ribonuclease P protein component
MHAAPRAASAWRSELVPRQRPGRGRAGQVLTARRRDARPTGSPWVSLGGAAVKALLLAPTVARTAHFALQATSRLATPETVDPAVAQKLPTAAAPDLTESVDNSALSDSRAAAPGLALVVPKRHARRAATRNLVKRQAREALRRRHAQWAGRDLLIRQRAAFASTHYRSAASDLLRAAVRSELERLFEQAEQGQGR